MGRPEAQVDDTVPELGALARQLRAWRQAAGLTYDQLAERAFCSSATLKRAASGKYLPDFPVAFSYADACLHDEPSGLTALARLYSEAKRAVEEHRRAARRSTVLPKPQLVRDLADLSGALRDQWAYAGRPSSRRMEAESNGHLSRSTAHMVTGGHTVPRDIRQYVVFLQVCGVNADALTPWITAWVKVRGLPTTNQYRRSWKWMSPDLKRLYSRVIRGQGRWSPQWQWAEVYYDVVEAEEHLADVRARIERLQQELAARERAYRQPQALEPGRKLPALEPARTRLQLLPGPTPQRPDDLAFTLGEVAA